LSWTTERARYSALRRYRDDDDPEVLNARRDLHAARLEDYVTRTLATAPPLTDEQRERLALLFQQPAASDGAAA
jgi:hypothetical protein